MSGSERPEVTREDIRNVVVGELLHDEAFADHWQGIVDSLIETGMEFSSPGGSPQRMVCGMLEGMFGLQPISLHRYTERPEVRAVLDVFANEVVRRAGGTGRPA